MKFGTHIVVVIDELHAKFHFLKLPLTRGFVIGSRVGRVSREFCTFLFEHFFRRQLFYHKSSSIWLNFGTHIMVVID